MSMFQSDQTIRNHSNILVAFSDDLWYAVLLQGGRTHERRAETALQQIYIPLPMTEAEQEIEACHKQLIERLEKPERKLVLRIMDNQSLIAEERSMDSFFCGFKLAWELAYELNHFETDRHPFPAEEAERDA